MKYQFISTHLHSYPVRAMCRALDVSTSGYYAARTRAPSMRSERQRLLTSKIHAIHLASRQTYGAPRVHAELCAQGFACSLNTVAKLMSQAQIMPKAIRRYRVTTDSRNTRHASPNLVNRDFVAGRPDNCWLSDITYIPTREGWLYLAVILDLHSRAVVGWAMSRTLDCRLAVDALDMAISRRGSISLKNPVSDASAVVFGRAIGALSVLSDRNASGDLPTMRFKRMRLPLPPALASTISLFVANSVQSQPARTRHERPKVLATGGDPASRPV